MVKKKTLVNKAFLLFSCILFLIISLIATVGYIISVRQINYSYIEQQLTIASETLRLRFMGMVNSELTLILKMADTPVIRQHFLEPDNPELEALAQIEFAIYQEHFKDSLVFWVNDADLIFYSSGNEPFVLDPGDPENYWYNLTMFETEQYNLNINYNPDLQQIYLWVNAPVFFETEEGFTKPVGILGTGINLTDFTDFIVSGESEFDQNVMPYMFNKYDEITTAIDYDLVHNKIRLDTHLGDAGAELIRVASLLIDEESQIFTYGSNMYHVSSIPAMEWFLAVSYPLPGFLALNRTINIVFFGMLFLILLLFVVVNIFNMMKERKERALNDQLAQERDIIQTMKDNIDQGIFLMDTELKILPQYSKPLVSIFSYYDSELEGKNFLDILSASLDAKQLQTMKGYFSMVFSKSKSAKVLESANPISVFNYKADNAVKVLSARFQLIERPGSEPVILTLIEDITREKEFERELQIQREAQQMEIKNLFDVIQIDPLVFQDFIEGIEENFDFINSTLKDKALTEKQALIKFFQNVHAMKSNALILGLESFGNKLHILEDGIKTLLNADVVNVEDLLSLAIELENLMREKDSFVKIIKRIEAYKTSHQLDSVLVYSLSKAVEKIAEETQKKVQIKAGQLDIKILESKLRKPIKDILFQCVRNSIHHGIETVEERIQKNKNPQGLLAVSVKNIDGKAEIIFSDDGRGLDWEKIKTRYQKLHPETGDINQKILLSSIFLPEFSTSEDTTLVAGRGIGLSLVKDLVKENKGSIKVNSSDGGLTFRIILPLAG